MSTISNQLKRFSESLKNSKHPRFEAELLLSHVLQKPRSYLFAHPEHTLTSDQIDQLHKLIQQRIEGQPIAYLLDEKEFWSLPLKVTPDTLIPRPETELLVELVLAKLPENIPQRVADLGTGTGAIALAIASERPKWAIQATDFSDKALDVARQNAKRLNIQNVSFSQGSWCDALNGGASYDAIVSNPPYIAQHDRHLVEGDVRFEPHEALVSGEDGLQDLQIIITQAKKHLAENGWLMVEHGYDQAEFVREMMDTAGYQQVSTFKDLSGIGRATMGLLK